VASNIRLALSYNALRTLVFFGHTAPNDVVINIRQALVHGFPDAEPEADLRVDLAAPGPGQLQGAAVQVHPG
jgi:hypothetical protein